MGESHPFCYTEGTFMLKRGCSYLRFRCYKNTPTKLLENTVLVPNTTAPTQLWYQTHPGFTHLLEEAADKARESEMAQSHSSALIQRKLTLPGAIGSRRVFTSYLCSSKFQA